MLLIEGNRGKEGMSWGSMLVNYCSGGSSKICCVRVLCSVFCVLCSVFCVLCLEAVFSNIMFFSIISLFLQII